MRICYIGDANAVHTQRWVQWFAADHEVSVISTTPDPGLEAYRLTTLPAHGSRRRLLDSVRVVRRVLKRVRPDLLHCHFINEAGWFGAASGIGPLVITAWGSDVYRAPRESKLAARLNPWAVRRAQAVTCDSVDQARVLRSWGVAPARLSVIGWGVDLQEFRLDVDGGGLRRRLDIPADAPLVLSPRQWYANSNIPTVVAAHARMDPDVYLLLKRASAFEPDRGAAVEAAIRCSPARDRIRILDEIGTAELPELYAAPDAVVSLCSSDGTPASVLEGMAAGKPVVALDIPSLAEWVGEPGGSLVPRLDPDLIADALMRFLRSPAARATAARHNRAVVEARADRTAEFERMADVYESLHERARQLEVVGVD